MPGKEAIYNIYARHGGHIYIYMPGMPGIYTLLYTPQMRAIYDFEYDDYKW